MSTSRISLILSPNTPKTFNWRFESPFCPRFAAVLSDLTAQHASKHRTFSASGANLWLHCCSAATSSFNLDLTELSAASFRMHRIWLLGLLWVCICFTDIANEPLRRSIDTPATGQWYSFTWYRRPGSDANDPVSQGKSVAALAAYQEAVGLATFAYQSLDRNDPIFLRYFEAADFRLVRGMNSFPLYYSPLTDLERCLQSNCWSD